MAALAATAASPQADDPVTALLRLEHAASDSSVSRGFADALAGVLDSEAVYLHPGATAVLGAGVTQDFLRSLPEVSALLVEWRSQDVTVSADTSLALTWGVATARPRSGGPAATRFGRYVAAWRRRPGGWRLAALATSSLFPPASVQPRAGEAPTVPDAGPATTFAAADRDFAALAGRRGAAEAFWRYASDDAVTFGGNGLLNRGRAAIRAGLAGDDASWRWHPVAALASRSGDIGFTVGESAITPRASAQTFYGKYLTLWRNERGGPRFLADIGNARPAPVSTP